MVHVLLTILKILGILILVILGIILTVILLVLLVPIRYGADVSFDGKPVGGVTVSWLLRMFSVRFSYDGKVSALVKLLWFRLFDKTVWPSEEDSDTLDEFSDELMEDEFLSLANEVTEEQKQVVSEKSEKMSSEVAKPKPIQAKTEARSEKTEATKAVVHNPTEETKQPKGLIKESVKEESVKEEPKSSLFEKIKSVIDKIMKTISDTIQMIRDKKEIISNKIDQVMSIIRNQENQKTFKLVMRQIGRLFKHILPKKIRGRLKFGFDDPYTTGQILTYISPFYGMYAKTLSLEPVFDEKVIEGEIHIKGRVRLGSLLWIVIRILFDKNFRRLLKSLLAKKK